MSLIKTAATTMSGIALGIGGLDPVVSKIPGASKFLHDYTQVYCNPNADGALANGATFNNMVEGGAGAVVSGTGLTSATGKTGLTGFVNAAAPEVLLGSGWDMAASGHSFFVSCWFKLPATGFVPGAVNIMSLTPSGGNINSTQWGFNTGSDGKTLHAQTGTYGYAGASGANLGAPVNLGLAWEPGAVQAFINGAQVYSGAGPASLPSAAGQQTIVGSYTIMEFYRDYFEDITLSGNTGLQAAQNEYTAGAARGFV